MEQKIQKILELPHGNIVWEMICDLRESIKEETSIEGTGPSITEHPLHEEFVQGVKILLGE